MEFTLSNNFDDMLDAPVVDQENVVEEDSDIEESISTEVSSESDVREEPSNEEDPSDNDSTDEDVPTYTDNALYTFLQSKGVKDPGKIQFENEDGTTEEVDFKELSPEEQLDIIAQVTDPGITEDEYTTINFLRRNGITLQQYADAYAQQAIEKYLSDNPDKVPAKVYSVDDYSDEDLMLIDLKGRYPDFTDEEISAELDLAKLDEERFTKKANLLRESYKNAEDQANAERAAQEQQQAQDLRNNIEAIANSFNEIQLDYKDDTSDSIVIEDQEKQKIISYIFDQDSDGKSQLVKALEDPNQLVKMVWLQTQGAELLSNLNQYWKGLLSKERAEKKKLQSQIEKQSKKSNGTVVVPKDPLTKTDRESILSGWDSAGLI